MPVEGRRRPAVRKHTDNPWVILYIQRWLNAPFLMPDGTIKERTKGTPQGGVISPVLANLFLHYAFDVWMAAIATNEAKWRLENIQDRITYCENEYETLEGSDALVIITEWNQFRNLDLDRVKKLLNQPYFFDLRNIYKREHMERQGFRYIGVGQGAKLQQDIDELGAIREVAATIIDDYKQ